MPAIQPARLKLQLAGLLESYTDPAAFCRLLDGLLEFYGDRIYRHGLAGAPPPLLPAYNVSGQVLRQVERELAPFASQQRQAALALCDAMWQVPNYEFRWLAAAQLGQIQPTPPRDILDRINHWTKPSTEERLIEIIFSSGLARLRQEQPKVYFQLAEGWLETGQSFYQHLGLKALRALLDTPEAANLPTMFQQITPLVRSAPASLRPDLLDILHRLAELSPRETAYFLRQNLSIQQDNPGSAWVTRNSLEYFPPEIQTSLRAALREAR